jgi:MinD-like ATPase involved in chromosome partitioning or flagellar assembly
VIAITSSGQATGKSVLAANLAFELARSQSVCLIDADFERASQHIYFGVNNAPASLSAITRLIDQDRFSEEDFDKLTLDLVVPNARVTLIAGVANQSAANILAPLAFETLLEFLNRKFDAVVVDAGTLSPENSLQQLILAKSQRVLLAELADQISIHRLCQNQETITSLIELEHTKLVLNRVRNSVLGANADSQLTETISEHTVFSQPTIMPEDAAFDQAMLKCLPLRQVSKRSQALTAIERLSSELVAIAKD